MITNPLCFALVSAPGSQCVRTVAGRLSLSCSLGSHFREWAQLFPSPRGFCCRLACGLLLPLDSGGKIRSMSNPTLSLSVSLCKSCPLLTLGVAAGISGWWRRFWGLHDWHNSQNPSLNVCIFQLCLISMDRCEKGQVKLCPGTAASLAVNTFSVASLTY